MARGSRAGALGLEEGIKGGVSSCTCGVWMRISSSAPAAPTLQRRTMIGGPEGTRELTISHESHIGVRARGPASRLNVRRTSGRRPTSIGRPPWIAPQRANGRAATDSLLFSEVRRGQPPSAQGPGGWCRARGLSGSATACSANVYLGRRRRATKHSSETLGQIFEAVTPTFLGQWGQAKSELTKPISPSSEENTHTHAPYTHSHPNRRLYFQNHRFLDP